MFATLLKTEFLKYGRSSWVPMIVIFYDAILAFVMILFMYSGNPAYDEYIYYNPFPYMNQFLVLSSIEIITTFLVVPVIISIMYSVDQQHHIDEQLALIPGATLRHTYTKVVVPVIVNFILFLSGAPILLVACIYSDISFWKMGLLSMIILTFSFWSAAVTTLFHSYWNRFGGPAIVSIAAQIVYCLGILFIVSMMGNSISEGNMVSAVPAMISQFCLVILLLNPFTSYMGFYSNLTGDISLMSGLCGPVGIDSTSQLFSMLFYKASIAGVVLMGTVCMIVACWHAGRTCIKTEKMLW